MSPVQKKIEISQDESFFNVKGIDFEAEDWRDINWETHNPTYDPSPFESIEWEHALSTLELIKDLKIA